jgi:hypothetical protein
MQNKFYDTHRILTRRMFTERKKYGTSSLDVLRISPAICLRKEKNAEQVLLDTHRISPAVSYGLKKQNHEVIEHILSVSVRKSGDLESTTKSCITFFCSW